MGKNALFTSSITSLVDTMSMVTSMTAPVANTMINVTDTMVRVTNNANAVAGSGHSTGTASGSGAS